MSDFAYFFTFQDSSIAFVVIGITLLGIGSAYVGTYSFLDKKALLGDAISHAVLPGICLGFMLAGEKNPLYIVTGAFLSGALATFLTSWLKSKTRLSDDAIIASILSIFFGFGVVLLTVIQKSGNPEMAGLNQFIFGNAIAILEEDLYLYGGLAILIIITLSLFRKEFNMLVFNPDFGSALGYPMTSIRLVFNVLMILSVVIGIQAIGVVLMAALLITPGAAARFWTNKLGPLLILAGTFSAISGIIGTYISFVIPQMPTGPWVVVSLSLLALISFLLAPKTGVLSRYLARRKYLKSTLRDHLLKFIFHAQEEGKGDLTIEEIYGSFSHKKQETRRAINNLKHSGLVTMNQNIINFTSAGKSEAKRIVRLHRLWELYLNEYMNIAPDHVHDSAEKLEHILTPELEELLESRLNYPKLDPHQEAIPRDNDEL
ncbi:metal ABC transporter permease [Algoriphagus halophytocola]|uniref:Metal ABC transporter permease n=1 Tax=Algoriphagus halophytocola TaxID=2991499 RepID=A0ABY6MMI3_9BACT|nr:MULTISPECIES: iron chelate uptake ABC transporter family permease subunit [unclassified Algoriphagus]UZD23531.1 metal ABC transporter permease [Algoriphagus sp. TR-M5]WBL44825.1 metal ABC transporter permease [Algoriphagus sp. TR-M9]